MIKFLFGNTINDATTEDKNTFVRLLIQEFPGHLRDAMTDELASTELSTLSQKEDEDLHAYYRLTETSFVEISRRDRVTYDGANTVTSNREKAMSSKRRYDDLTE